MGIQSLAYVVISPRRNKTRIGSHRGIVKFCLLHSYSDILSLGKDLKRCLVPAHAHNICAAIDRPIFIVLRSSLCAMVCYRQAMQVHATNAESLRQLQIFFEHNALCCDLIGREIGQEPV